MDKNFLSIVVYHQHQSFVLQYNNLSTILWWGNGEIERTREKRKGKSRININYEKGKIWQLVLEDENVIAWETSKEREKRVFKENFSIKGKW